MPSKVHASCFCLLAAIVSFWETAGAAEVPNATRFVVHAIGGVSTEQTKAVIDALEASYDRIGADLKTVPAMPFNVHLYSNRWSYVRATGNWGASGNIEGSAKLHVLLVSSNGDSFETFAVHEFAHAVMLKLLLDHEPTSVDDTAFSRKFERFPIWLWEAIAVYEAKQLVPPKKLSFISKTSYPSLAELSDRSKGGKIYKVGYTIIEYILAEYGQEGLIKLVLAYGDLASLKTTPEAFGEKWHAFVVKKYLE